MAASLFNEPISRLFKINTISFRNTPKSEKRHSILDTDWRVCSKGVMQVSGLSPPMISHLSGWLLWELWKRQRKSEGVMPGPGVLCIKMPPSLLQAPEPGSTTPSVGK